MKIKSKLRHFLVFVYFLFGRKPKYSDREESRTRVIVFHHLDKPKRFEDLISNLKKKYNIITFKNYLEGKIDKTKINLIIAFDDGYKSCFHNGKSIFCKHDIKPLFFLNSDFIGLDSKNAYSYCIKHINTWKDDSLSWEEVKNLKELGCQIGGHTHKHTDLTDIKKNGKTFFNIICKDKLKIDKKLNQNTSIFAYPFGRWNDSVLKEVKKSGYEYAFTSDSGYLEDSANNHSLLRTNIGMRPSFIAKAYVEGCAETLTSDIAKIKSFFRVF